MNTEHKISLCKQEKDGITIKVGRKMVICGVSVEEMEEKHRADFVGVEYKSHMKQPQNLLQARISTFHSSMISFSTQLFSI